MSSSSFSTALASLGLGEASVGVSIALEDFTSSGIALDWRGLIGTDKGFCLGLNNDRRPDADNRCRLGAGGRMLDPKGLWSGSDWFTMTANAAEIDQTSERRSVVDQSIQQYFDENTETKSKEK
jgi:hypothetical protein